MQSLARFREISHRKLWRGRPRKRSQEDVRRWQTADDRLRERLGRLLYSEALKDQILVPLDGLSQICDASEEQLVRVLRSMRWRITRGESARRPWQEGKISESIRAMRQAGLRFDEIAERLSGGGRVWTGLDVAVLLSRPEIKKKPRRKGKQFMNLPWRRGRVGLNADERRRIRGLPAVEKRLAREEMFVARVEEVLVRQFNLESGKLIFVDDLMAFVPEVPKKFVVMVLRAKGRVLQRGGAVAAVKRDRPGPSSKLPPEHAEAMRGWREAGLTLREVGERLAAAGMMTQAGKPYAPEVVRRVVCRTVRNGEP